MKAASLMDIGEGLGMQPAHFPIERRSRRRYPLRLFVTGWFVGRRRGRIVGETLDISSRGLLFSATEPIPPATRVQLEIAWPLRSGEGEEIALRVLGTVVRSTGNVAAARIWSHSFRAASTPRPDGLSEHADEYVQPGEPEPQGERS